MNDSTHPVARWSTGTMQLVAEQPSLADAALGYADLGIPVFPCVPGGKQPLTPNGFHDATSSARIVRRWWERTPEANIGLPTGSGTGILVVDVDVHAAGSGFAAFERSRAAGLAEGWGWLVRTPSGGLHAYYPTTRDLEQRSWQVPTAHIDFRGDGGYVIAPPSRLPIADAPAPYVVLATAHHPPHGIDGGRLRRFLEPPRRLPPPPSLRALGSQPDKLAEWVAHRPEGARNAGLFWAACRLAEGGQPYDDASAVLGAAGARAGLPDGEIESTIRSAYRIASRLSAQPAPASRPGPTRQGEVIEL